jgi:hypothetical protein
MSDTSDVIATFGDLSHIAAMVAMETQREFYLEISRVEADLRAILSEQKKEIGRLRKLVLRHHAYVDYLSQQDVNEEE